MFVNIIGSVFAVVGIVLYGIDLGESNVEWMCDWGYYDSTGPPERCRYVAHFAQVSLLLKDKGGFMIHLQLDLC